MSQDDPISNSTLMSRLDQWAREDARIDPDPRAFSCRFYDECNTSAGGQLCGGKYSSMSYVGREFGAGFRLALVGMDHGQKEGRNFAQARSGIEHHYQTGGGPFNPHYKGVLRTAVAILGSSAEDCGRMCKDRCQKSRESRSSCVIDRIAQLNLVKCVSESQVDRKSRTTTVMQVRCAHHLIAELKIMKPQLVAFHGAEATWPTKHAIEQSGDSVKAVDDVKDRRGQEVLYQWPVQGAHILFLHHPAYGGLSKQWDTVVVPALNYLRANGCIPT